MRTACAVFGALFSGFAAVLPAAIFWMVIGVPVRLMYLFSERSAPRCAAAMAAGSMTGALAAGGVAGAFATMSGLRLPGGATAGCAAMLLCGVSSGMIAAALSEIIELFPTLVYRARLRRGVAALIAAFTGGKVLGAFFASL